MLILVLMLLAASGSGAVTYFLMDAPRRRAFQELGRLSVERYDLQMKASELDERSRRVEARSRQIDDAARAHDTRVRDFETKFTAFERRIITYDELSSENVLLKAELRNMLLYAAHQEYEQHESGNSVAAVAGWRDRLGRSYLDAVRDAQRKSLTPDNYTAKKQQVRAVLDELRTAGASVDSATEKEVLDDLDRQFDKVVWAARERENQARIRERIREEQQAEREMRQAQEAAAAADKERQRIEAELTRAITAAAGQHAAEVDRLRALLADAEAKSRRAISMAEITKSGYVYIISNVGSFGSGVFKIGMTRREYPMDRVHELGDASVPFPFDVHMMVTTEDAPRLERALHRAFHMSRVNRANSRKEFFRVSLDEIVKAVQEHHGEVEYTADPEALQYLRSQAVTDEDLRRNQERYVREDDQSDDLPNGSPDKL